MIAEPADPLQMASADSRTAYVTMLKGYIDANGWDGVDADWEYPGAAGNTQDFDLKNDLPNFLLFFEELRKTLGDDVLITVDTSAKTWADPGTGEPSTDLGDFAKHLDFFTIMTYGASLPRLALCTHTLTSDLIPIVLQTRGVAA